MKAYDVVTKFYDGQWQTEPKLIHTFYEEGDAYRFIRDCVIESTFAEMILRKTLFQFYLGERPDFGAGAKMYCVVREV